MGARLSPSCHIAGFIREFDLVKVDYNASMRYPCLKCRKFEAWEEEESGPIMEFCPIVIGPESMIWGMLCPGVKVGTRVLVEKLAVVPESSILEGGTKISGNPAFVSGRTKEERKYPPWITVGLFKILWVPIELSIVYGIWAGAEYLNSTSKFTSAEIIPLPIDIAYWVIFAVTCMLLSLLSSIVLKFILVGVRRPGKQSEWWCYHPTEWAADYHFYLVTLPFRIFARNSRAANVILMLHGMDVDFLSKVEMESFPPSKMDLVRVRRSFIGTVTFDVKSEGAFYKSHIEDSSLGQFCHVKSGVSIFKTLIPPLTVVNENVIRHQFPADKQPMGHTCKLYIGEVFIFLFYKFMLIATALTVIPAYMVWDEALKRDYVSLKTCVPICAASFIAQGLTWHILFMLSVFVTFLGACSKREKPWIPGLYWVYQNTSFVFQRWSFFRFTYGSPIYNMLARLMFASFQGKALYFGSQLLDFPLTEIGHGAVLDGALVAGHNIVYGQLDFGRSHVEGIVHDYTFVLAKTTMTTTEAGPWHAVVPFVDTQSVQRRSSTAMSMLPRTLMEEALEAGESLDALVSEKAMP